MSVAFVGDFSVFVSHSNENEVIEDMHAILVWQAAGWLATATTSVYVCGGMNKY